MSKTPFYKTGLGTYQGQTSDGALSYSSPLFLTEEEKLKLKEKGEKKYGEEETTTTSKKVEGGTEYTDTTTKDWTAKDKYEGKTFKEAGVSAEEGKKYWEENPEEYQAYLASKNKTRSGTDENVNTRFVADPVEEKPKFAINPDSSYDFDFYRESRSGGQRGTASNPGFTSISNKSGDKVNEMLTAYKNQSTMIEKDYGAKTEQQWAEKRGWDADNLSDARKSWIAKSQAKHADLYKHNMPKVKIFDKTNNQYLTMGSSGQLEPITIKS